MNQFRHSGKRGLPSLISRGRFPLSKAAGAWSWPFTS